MNIWLLLQREIIFHPIDWLLGCLSILIISPKGTFHIFDQWNCAKMNLRNVKIQFCVVTENQQKCFNFLNFLPISAPNLENVLNIVKGLVDSTWKYCVCFFIVFHKTFYKYSQLTHNLNHIIIKHLNQELYNKYWQLNTCLGGTGAYLFISERLFVSPWLDFQSTIFKTTVIFKNILLDI